MYVSTDPMNPDSIVISIKKQTFSDPELGTVIDFPATLTKEIPRQMDPDFAEVFTEAVE